MKDDAVYVRHILECIRRIEEDTADDRESFMGSHTFQDAVLRNLQTLAESPQRLSEEAKSAHPEMDWRRIAAFRNVLVHDYLGLDLDSVWKTVKQDVPHLKRAVTAMLEKTRYVFWGGRVNTHIIQVIPSDPLWPEVAALFPRAAAWMNDPNDDGDCRFFAAVDEKGTFLGGSVVDVRDLGFGPLSKSVVGFLEDIEVLEPYRRTGVGTALLRATLDHAWRFGCGSVRWTVDYANAAGIALYEKLGAGFVPEEDPEADEPEECYTVVAINPARVRAGYGRSA